jgi:ribosome modulation factor
MNDRRGVAASGHLGASPGGILGRDGEVPSSECWAEQARAAKGRTALTYALYSGVNAFCEGLAEADCPFHAVSEIKIYDEWIYGWRAAARGAKSRAEKKQIQDATYPQNQEYWWDSI